MEHHTTLDEVGEGSVQAVCSCGWRSPVFGADKTYVFFCAGGLRSALAAKTAQDMGLRPVAHIVGGFGAWKAAGGPVEAPQHAAGGDDAKP